MMTSKYVFNNIFNKNTTRYIYATILNRSYCSAKNESFDGKKKYDIIIAGGGMVGCTLACALGKNSLMSDLKILLLEGSPKQNFTLKPEYSNRVVALNQNTKTLMNKLKVWNHIEEMRLQPVRSMQIWDACSNAIITFDSNDLMNNDVAYIVENDVLLHSVNKELVSSDVRNVDIVYGAKIKGYKLANASDLQPECIIQMENGDTYSCQLLVGADGANSAVRRAMGVQYLSWNYDQMGVVGTLMLSEQEEYKLWMNLDTYRLSVRFLKFVVQSINSYMFNSES